MASHYVERSLQPGETLEYQGRASRVAALHHAAIALIIALIALGIVGNTEQKSGHGKSSGGVQVLGVIAFLAMLSALLNLIRGYVFLKNAEYVVTDRRVVGKYGFIRRYSVDVLVTQIAGISVTQTVLGRIFRYGTVWVNGSGARRQLVWVSNPLAFQAAVHRRLEASRLLMGTAAYTLDVRVAPDEGAPRAESRPAPPGPGARFCPQCGGGLSPGARFCEHCSAPVAPTAS